MKKKRIVSLLCLILTMISLMTSVVWAALPSGGTAGSDGPAGGTISYNGGGDNAHGRYATRTRYVFCYEDENGVIKEFPSDYHIIQADRQAYSDGGTAPQIKPNSNRYNEYKTYMGSGTSNIIASQGETYFENKNTSTWIWKWINGNKRGYVGTGAKYYGGTVPKATIKITEKDSIKMLNDIKTYAQKRNDTSTLELIDNIMNEKYISHIKVYADIRSWYKKDGKLKKTWGTGKSYDGSDEKWETFNKIELKTAEEYWDYFYAKDPSIANGGCAYIPGSKGILLPGYLKQSWKTMDGTNLTDVKLQETIKDNEYSPSINDAEISSQYRHVKTTLRTFEITDISDETEITQDPYLITGTANIGYEIVYWYEEQSDTTTIKINYKDEKTGKNICPSEMVEPGTHSKKDFDGYEYTGLEIIKPNPEAKDPNKTSVTITDDKEAHEVTFWYKPEEITIVKVTHKSKGGQILQGTTSYTIKENGSSQTFSQIASALGGGWNYVGVDATCDGNTLKDQATDTSVTVSYNGSASYEITFWYAMQTQVKIMGRCEGMAQPIYTEDAGSFDLPLNKTFKEKDYTPSKAYKFLDEYEVKEGTLGWTSKGSTETGNSVTLTYDEATTTPQQVLIVFYYESKCTLTVNHIYVDPITGNEKVEKTISDIQIIPGEEKSVSSISMNNYLNLKYESSSEVTAVGFTKYSKAQNNIYTLKFTPSEKSYTINFYYTSQTITVKHIQNNEVKKEETKVLDPNHGEEALTEYPLQKWVLNETEIGTETPKKVPIKEGTSSQELIFYYQEPNLIFGPDDPNDYKEYPDGKTYKDMVNDYQTGIIPSDLNNQTINQKDSEYYWVLNQNGGLLIRFANTHLEEGSGSCTFVAKIKIPFDVYVGRVSKSANTELTVTCQYKQTSNGYDIYTGTLENIYVPIWVTEGDYKIAGTVVSTYKSNDGSTKTTTSNATATVKVVGAVYDFTITNLDGADLTGDTMWKKALFGTGEGYKATETAVGQATQQSKNYNYGIKRGTRFYFSLNTLGAKNKKIEIVPSFYYVSADGTQTKVTMKSNYLNETRSISLTDTNRTTTEFKNERAKKAEKTSTTIFTVGNYNKITLDSNVNTPYLGIASELTVKDVKSGITLSDYANHWYGDYSIPNDAKFYKADGTLVSDETGVVVVYFEIKTIDDKNAEYLAYNGDSPFVQTTKISEWNYERQNKNLSTAFNNSMTMPKVSTSAAKVVDEVWKKDTSTAAIIYSLRASATTKQNVTSVGTH